MGDRDRQGGHRQPGTPSLVGRNRVCREDRDDQPFQGSHPTIFAGFGGACTVRFEALSNLAARMADRAQPGQLLTGVELAASG
jgi:hypothetical protein